MKEQKRRAVHRHDDARRAPVAARDAHAHATTSRASPRPIRAALPNLFSLEMLGRGDVRRRRCASSTRTRGSGSRRCARARPNILTQMLLRGSNGVGYTNYPDNVVKFFVTPGGEGRRRRVPHLRLPQLGREHARLDRRGGRGRQGVPKAPSATPATCSIRTAPSTTSSITWRWPRNWRRRARMCSASRTWRGC